MASGRVMPFAILRMSSIHDSRFTIHDSRFMIHDSFLIDSGIRQRTSAGSTPRQFMNGESAL